MTELHGLLQEEVHRPDLSTRVVGQAGESEEANALEYRDYLEPRSWCLPTKQMWKGA